MMYVVINGTKNKHVFFLLISINKHYTNNLLDLCILIQTLHVGNIQNIN